MDQPSVPVPRPWPPEELIDLLRRACEYLSFRDLLLRFLRACGAAPRPRLFKKKAKKKAEHEEECTNAAKKAEHEEECTNAAKKAEHEEECTNATKKAAAAAKRRDKKKAKKADKKAADLGIAKPASSPRDRAPKADHDALGRACAAKEAKNAARDRAAKKAAAKKTDTAASIRAPLDRARAAKDADHSNGRAKEKERALSPSATVSASPAPAGPSSSTRWPEPEEEERYAHERYLQESRNLKRRKVTPCMICYLDLESKVLPIANKEEDIDRHVARLHKGGVVHCEKSGCYAFGKDRRQIGMHQYYAHKI